MEKNTTQDRKEQEKNDVEVKDNSERRTTDIHNDKNEDGVRVPHDRSADDRSRGFVDAPVTTEDGDTPSYALNHMDKEDREFFVEQNVNPQKQNVNIKGFPVGNPTEKYAEPYNPHYANEGEDGANNRYLMKDNYNEFNDNHDIDNKVNTDRKELENEKSKNEKTTDADVKKREEQNKPKNNTTVIENEDKKPGEKKK